MIVNKGRNILVIDLEFAQTYKKKLNKSAIMEIGMVFVSNIGTPEENEIHYSKMCNPGVGINYYVTKVTGITEKMLKGLPPIERHYKEIQSFIDKADILVFHGGKPDILALANSGFNLNGKETIDTQTLARASRQDFSSYALSEVADTLEIEFDGAHRALNDAKMTLALYRELVDQESELTAMYRINF